MCEEKHERSYVPFWERKGDEIVRGMNLVEYDNDGVGFRAETLWMQ